LVQKEVDALSEFNISRGQIMAHYLVFTRLEPEGTNGNIAGQVRGPIRCVTCWVLYRRSPGKSLTEKARATRNHRFTSQISTAPHFTVRSVSKQRRHARVCDASESASFWAEKVGLTLSPGLIRVQRQTAQQGEERRRLADEEPHCRQEIDHIHGNSLGLSGTDDGASWQLAVYE
jgi:hypothetical protein